MARTNTAPPRRRRSTLVEAKRDLLLEAAREMVRVHRNPAAAGQLEMRAANDAFRGAAFAFVDAEAGR